MITFKNKAFTCLTLRYALLNHLLTLDLVLLKMFINLQPPKQLLFD